MQKEPKRGVNFWAKTDSEGNPGISVRDHMIDVGAVAYLIAERFRPLAERFGLDISTVAALAALHDLGKISPGFQCKCVNWLAENGLLEIARNGAWDTNMESDHGKVTHALLQAFLGHAGADRKTAKYASTVLGAHHGRLGRPSDRSFIPQRRISESTSGIDWDDMQMEHAKGIWDHFTAGQGPPEVSSESPALWWLAGLTSVADWIGSDERFFPATKKRVDINAGARARQALAAISFTHPRIVSGLSFHDLFHDPLHPESRWVPNDVQEKAAAMIRGPGVYIIEAPMGVGKTEAALWAAYHLLAPGKAMGIYFALPTQATSNRIHIRMDEFLRRISPESGGSRLIHGSSWLMAADAAIHPVATDRMESGTEDARTGLDWFGSSKRALLAPFGVGTVDQALLGVVAAKHFFVRHFALAGKVVVLDEVHSYDLYTGTLIDKLITMLEGLGCTVIVLSATLTGKRRRQIVAGSQESESATDLAYPLISGRADGVPFDSVPVSGPPDREVIVEFSDKEIAAGEGLGLAWKGAAVLWICNTVDSAQAHYLYFQSRSNGTFPVGLLHSRFPFQRRKEIEAEWMGRLDKSGKTRCGCILVSTQVVEQSVDLDADFMVTELAPTDMLLQRLGRLWRHTRDSRPIHGPRFCILEEEEALEELRSMEPAAIAKMFGQKANIYAPFVLLRTLEVWRHQVQKVGSVLIPSQIRQLIEATYAERDNEPAPWKALAGKWLAGDAVKQMTALRNSNPWQPQLADEEGIQTRLSEIPTLSLVLCRTITEEEITLLDGTGVASRREPYRLAAAQAAHKNLVKVPIYCFDAIEPCPAIADYLHGQQTVGVVELSGEVTVKGLKDGFRLHYSDQLGLVIDRVTERREHECRVR